MWGDEENKTENKSQTVTDNVEVQWENMVDTWWTLSEQLNSLLLKAQYQPVIQNIFFWLPRAVPKEERRNMRLFYHAKES